MKRKWPKKVKRNDETWKAGKPIKLTTGWYVMFTLNYGSSYGNLDLPDGWQDMDRTWTAQDIFWVDKVDCANTQERVLHGTIPELLAA